MYQPSLRVEIERISKELLNLRDNSVDDKNIFEMLAALRRVRIETTLTYTASSGFKFT
ncbi:hypothetical protein FACS189443_6920 [Planctomycetales bacterium]|nr:hypothetical protein FACS189443_6920 [Planctomycetales bacterium]